METLIFITVLALAVAVRLFLGKLASDFVASLPAEERARISSSMVRGTC